MSWIQVHAEFPSGGDLSPFIEIFRDYGIENTLEEETTLTGAIANVEGAQQRVSDLTEALTRAGALRVQTQDLPEENWEIAWRQFFKPRRMGRHFVVRPTWEEFGAGPGDLEIVLDPGQAFGTGDHPTTRLCLELLENAEVANSDVVDIGCGSGILSVAACKLGARSVTAIDIEPISVEVTKENMALNDVRFEAFEGEGLSLPSIEDKTFDVVISNIISAILIRLARDVFAATRPRGRWIVSGIISQNWPDVRRAAEVAGFSLAEEREEDGWVAARFSRP